MSTNILAIIMCIIVCSPLIIAGVQIIRSINSENKIKSRHPLPNDPNLLLKQVYEDMQATEPLSDKQRKVFQKWRERVREAKPHS